jgi:RNA polymerase sigma factor (sigma-70 family)
MKPMFELESASDARLVELSLSGERNAFGQIVARYQAPICALAYSACGNVSRSEDLAQEVFITAWRRLPDLREPSKFRAWLFGIARNLVNNAFRRQSRNPLADAEPLDEALGDAAGQPTAPEAAITREEAAILWRVLEAMPETYRDPMVLFYRQDECIAGIAELLGVSDEVVRQRLSRGRAMLHERVAKVVERGLRRSGPGEDFTLTVVSALPLAVTKAGAVAVAGTKAAGAAKGAGLLAGLASALLALVPITGAAFGILGRVQNAASPRERRFLARTCWIDLAFVIIALGTMWMVLELRLLRITSRLVDTLGWSLLWLGFLGPLLAYSVWIERARMRIRMEDGTFRDGHPCALWGADPAVKGFKSVVYGSLAAMIFGSGLCVLSGFSIRFHDKLLLAVLPVPCLAGWLVSARATLRNPQKAGSVFIIVWLALTLFILAVLNLRWDFWQGNVSSFEFPGGPAPFGLNLLILVFFGSIGLMAWVKHRLIDAPSIKRTGAITAALYAAIMLACFAWFAHARHAQGLLPAPVQSSIHEIQGLRYRPGPLSCYSGSIRLRPARLPW